MSRVDAVRAGPWIRGTLALAVAVAGLFAVANSYLSSSWYWPLVLIVGVVAGVVAGAGRQVWVVWVAAVLAAILTIWPGPRPAKPDPLYWVALTVVGACLATAGFAIGAWIAARARWSTADGSAPADGRTIGSPLLVAALAVGLIGFGGWVGLAGTLGSQKLLYSTTTWPHCGTPASVYGWAYEAINYDQADDTRLAAVSPGLHDCTDFGASTAGSEVVASDGVRIAGWYIPAASGVGPHGPTLLIVPGYESHMSEVLKYAPPFHESYDLVLIDLRDQGRSGRTAITWGLREQLDVHAMIDWLVRTKDPGWIGAMGNSMGAASILAEAVHDQRVQALILDSMHASVLTAFGDTLEYEQHLPGVPTAWAMVLGASLRLAADLTSVDPVRTIQEVGHRPVLLIHGLADQLDHPETSAEANVRAAREAKVPVQLRYCPSGYHGHVIDMCPMEWAAWATDFLAAARTASP